MRSFQSKLADLRPPCMPSEHYNYLQTLHWENEYTARIRRAIGDDKLCMAYSPKAKCWAVARKIKVHVKFGELEPALMETPMIWLFWVGPNKEALEPDDTRLEATIRAGDTWTRGASALVDEIEAGEEALAEADQKRTNDATDDLVRELRPALARAADELGLTRHRTLGTEGGKISTASLWRAGSGA